MAQEDAGFEGWAVVELMGHRRVAGYVRECEIAGARFLQVDIPREDGTSCTQLYSPAAVYCITPVAEELARAAARTARVVVLHPWEIRDLVRDCARDDPAWDEDGDEDE